MTWATPGDPLKAEGVRDPMVDDRGEKPMEIITVLPKGSEELQIVTNTSACRNTGKICPNPLFPRRLRA